MERNLSGCISSLGNFRNSRDKAFCGARPLLKSRPSMLLACGRPSGPSTAWLLPGLRKPTAQNAAGNWKCAGCDTRTNLYRCEKFRKEQTKSRLQGFIQNLHSNNLLPICQEGKNSMDLTGWIMF